MSIERSVAIIGMACRLPGAADLASFWRNLTEGRESVTFFSKDQLEPPFRRLADLPGFVPAAAIVDDIDLFDAPFFRMSAREAQLADPQHRLFLEAAWTALEDAGYGDPEALRRAVGVYAGSMMSSYALNARGHLETPAEEFEAFIGTGIDYLTTFLSYKLGLSGESIAVQTACSTSLVAIHLACQSLLTGQVDMALAGGVSIDARQRGGYVYQEGMVLSPDGHCRPFDREARGTVRGYGLGLVVLKRLEDALADRDHIRAIIRGSATNNDGRNKVGYTAPSARGQAEVIRTALAMAETRPETIGLVEAHGTGTTLGDPIEIEALVKAFGRGVPPRTCAVGSVKSNFGHLVEAAGVAALIKAVLALEHGELPPSINFERPNPRIDFGSTPFFVNDRRRPFEPRMGVRRATVSSFGIGGTNANLVLEEAGSRPPTAHTPPAVFVLSARSAPALANRRAALRAWVLGHLDASPADVAFTLAVGRKSFDHRFACVAGSLAELARALDGAHEAAGWTGLVEARGGAQEVVDPRPAATDRPALDRLCQSWTRGEPVDWPSLYPEARRISLPTYPFERQRHWLSPRSSGFSHGLAWWLSGTGPAGPDHPPEGAEREPQLLLVAAQDRRALEGRTDRLSRLIAGEADGKVVRALCDGASASAEGPERLAIAFEGPGELTAALESARADRSDPRVFRGSASAGKIAFVFGGQGGEWPGMGAGMLRYPAFAATLRELEEAFQAITGRGVLEPLSSAADRSSLAAMDRAQPAIFAFQVATAALWRSYGIEPEGVIGHSMGEVAAAYVAGALSLEDAVRVIHHRSVLLASIQGTGATAFVALSEDEAQSALADLEASASVVGINDDNGTVIGGTPEGIATALRRFEARGIFCKRLPFDVAAHSRQVEPLCAPLRAALAELDPVSAKIPFISSVDAQELEGQSLDRGYWARNLRSPIRFARALERALALGFGCFLEVSPHPILFHSIELVLARRSRPGLVLASAKRGQPAGQVVNRTLAALFAAGHRLSWPAPGGDDHQELASLGRASPGGAPPPPPPGSVVGQLRALVGERLGRPAEQVDPEALLLDLGLESVTALSLLVRINRRFGADLRVAELLALGTISAIARRLESGAVVERPALVVTLRAEPPPAPEIVLFPGAGGSAVTMAGWARGEVLPAATIRAIDPEGQGSAPRPALHEVQRLATALGEHLAPDARGPLLVGYSLGGLTAFAVARALECAGRRPLGVVVVCGLPPRSWKTHALRSDAPEFAEIFGAYHDRLAAAPSAKEAFIARARADFAAAQGYDAGDHILQCPLHVIGSEDDSIAPLFALADWRRHARHMELHPCRGHHFEFLERDDNRQILRAVCKAACDRPSPRAADAFRSPERESA